MFYMGTEFNAETNKAYKTEKGGKEAAEKNLMCLFDEAGEIIADFRPDEPAPEPAPADVDDTPEADVKIYEPDAAEKGLKGKIRRKFNGALRLRRSPSWDVSAVAGTTVFTEKSVVAALTVDGKPMYKTKDGYYITGNPDMVEFVAE